jgi:bifunctional enzyme CysN/CysC
VSDNVRWHDSEVSGDARTSLLAGPGATIWLTGLSGSGKSTLANRAESELVAAGRAAYSLDGDNLRHGLNSDLAFSAEDRTENVRRVGEVARLMADAGVVTLAPLISPYADGRLAVRAAHEDAGVPFYLVHVSTPLEVCESRDAKGLYAKARAGEITDFTGINAPYEDPDHPDIAIDTSVTSLGDAVTAILSLLE